MAGTGGSYLTGSLETGAQLQLPHVAHHCCGIKCLLHGQRERERGEEKKLKKNLLCLTATEKEKQQRRTKCALTPANLNTALSAGCDVIQPKALTFHLLLAKFFLI